MAGISLTGMASGLDTDSIISQLMALEQNKVTAVQMRQVKVQAHKDDLSSIKTKLDAFKTAATALSDAATWKATQTTSSSDITKLGVTLLSGAGIGGHTVQIDKLASSAQHGFTYTSSATAGSFDLSYAPTAARSDAGEGHDQRRRQRDRVRRRDADQRQRERPGLRRGDQGRLQQRAHRPLRAQDRPGLELRGRHDRAWAPAARSSRTAPTRAPAPR